MDTQPATSVISTKIPATVVFTVGLLLFFMPFAELKCNKSDANTDVGGFNLNLGGQMTVSNTGLGLAIGGKWKSEMNGLGGMLSGSDKINEQQQKQDPNNYAIAALGLGIIGLVFCFIKMRGANWIALVSGILSAAALIGLKFDLDKKIKEPSNILNKNDNSSDWMTGGLDAMKFELNYTPWFYIAIMAMLAAAVLCYLRMKNSRVG